MFKSFLKNSSKYFFIGILFVGVLSHADDYTDAKNAYENGQFAKAVSLYTKGCKNKDAKSCGQLGWLYDIGSGVQKDPFKSVDLYTKGCTYGNGPSCNLIGQMYFQGRVVANDDMKALSFFKKGCALNDAWSCAGVTNVEDKHGVYNKNNLSKTYSLFGLKKNKNDDIKNKINSCDNGNIKECLVLGQLYLSGADGFPKDSKKGVLYLTKGCDSKEPIKNGLACMYASAVSFKYEKNVNESQSFIYKAIDKFDLDCKKGNGKACIGIAGIYKNGIAFDGIELMRQDINKANIFMKKGCDLGEQDGCQNFILEKNENKIKKSDNQSEKVSIDIEDDVSQKKAEKERLNDQKINEVRTIVASNFRYPKEAVRKRLEGTSTVSFDLLESGKIENLVIIESSGESILDEEALKIIQTSSSRFPVLEKKTKITIPLAFKLH